MPIQVIMPQLGESVVEGTVTKWLKSIGDPIEEFEPLLEVNTDKVDSEIPSPAAGTLLEIQVQEGTTVQAGTVLALISEAGEASPEGGVPGESVTHGDLSSTRSTEPAGNGGRAQDREQQEPMHGQTTAATGISVAGKDRDLGFISPVVAKIARQENLDLAQVVGTGQGGRITKRDVMEYLERREQGETVTKGEGIPVGRREVEVSPGVRQVEAPAITAPSPSAPSPAAAPAMAGAPPGPPVAPGEAELVPMTAVRRSIADHMVASKRTSPHVTTVMEVDLGRVVAHREANKAQFARDGANLTFTAYFIAAAVSALKAFPIVNSSWSDEGLLLHKHIHIGMATSLGEAGLIVPVIKNADTLSLLGLARAINDLAQRARARQLKPDEVKGGTFTLTNHGTSGSLFATPIINQPQCGILGVGAIQKRVVVVSEAGFDSIAIRPMAYISLTFDHRILDGAIADTFLGRVVESLKNWG